MADQGTPRWEGDTDYTDKIVAKVSGPVTGPYELEFEDGWCFGCSPDFVPKPGMIARQFGKGAIRGLLLDGREVFYRTAEEDKAHWERERYGADAQALLDRWDSGRGIWTIAMGGFSPGYEQAIQIAAMEMLRVLLAEKVDTSTWRQPDQAVALRTLLDRKAEIEHLGLSGMQWGAAFNLATGLYENGPLGWVKAAPDDRQIQCSKGFPRAPVLGDDGMPLATFTHIEDGGRYIVESLGEMKHPDTGEWLPSISYQSLETGKRYTTTQERWKGRFRQEVRGG